jgi:hypothetical protein
MRIWIVLIVLLPCCSDGVETTAKASFNKATIKTRNSSDAFPPKVRVDITKQNTVDELAKYFPELGTPDTNGV